MSTEEVVPCINCICVAICRLKTFSNLYSDCVLIKEHLYGNKVITFRFKGVYEALSPSLWDVNENGHVFTRQRFVTTKGGIDWIP